MLVRSVGLQQGDGTVLSASHFLDDGTPLVGINSDPGDEEDKQVIKKADERRRCAAAAADAAVLCVVSLAAAAALRVHQPCACHSNQSCSF